jgi:hypothetical protein
MGHYAGRQRVLVRSQDRIEVLSRSLAGPTLRRRLLRLLGIGVATTPATAVGLNEALNKSNRNNRRHGFQPGSMYGAPVPGGACVVSAVKDIKRVGSRVSGSPFG